MVNKPLVLTGGLPTATQLSDVDIAGTTAGAIPFVSSGALAESPNLTFDGTHQFVGAVPLNTINGLLTLSSASAPEYTAVHAGATPAIGVRASFNRARGTPSSPTVINTSDNIGNFTFQGYDGTSAYRTSALFGAFVIEPSPSPTAMGGQLKFSVTPLGSVGASEIVRLEFATGFSMFGANPVIDQNRSHILRGYTVATLPTLTGTSIKMPTAFVNDSTLPIGTGLGLTVIGGGTNRVPVFDDGTSWKIG